MRLYTPLSDVEARQAERASLTGRFFWVDRPDLSEADANAVWVAIDVPDDQLIGFETDSGTLGYREFELPSNFSNEFRTHRVRLSDDRIGIIGQ